MLKKSNCTLCNICKDAIWGSSLTYDIVVTEWIKMMETFYPKTTFRFMLTNNFNTLPKLFSNSSKISNVKQSMLGLFLGVMTGYNSWAGWMECQLYSITQLSNCQAMMTFQLNSLMELWSPQTAHYSGQQMSRMKEIPLFY